MTFFQWLNEFKKLTKREFNKFPDFKKNELKMEFWGYDNDNSEKLKIEVDDNGKV